MRWATAPRYAFLPGALLVAVLDQITKLLVVRLMSPGEPIAVIGPVLSLTYVRNRGGAFSLLPDATGWLAVVSALVVVILAFYGLRAPGPTRSMSYGLALVLGGALGNLADRAFRGWVVDFLDLHFWPIFNVADIAITVGVVLIACRLLWPPRSAAADRTGTDSSERTIT